MIQAVIFDLDGVLINSEPLWKRAEQKILKTVGINLTLEMAKQTTGMQEKNVVEHWYARYPWNHKSIDQVTDEVHEEVTKLIIKEGQPTKGVYNILKYFEDKKLRMAVASASPMKLIQTVLEKLNIKDKFAAVFTSEDVEYGKPHPAVYISTAKNLNVAPENCLVFEDSFNGALSAKAARMKVVGVLVEDDYNSPRFGFLDLKIRSFNEFEKEHFYMLKEL